ncbi:PA2779 family protein [Rhodospirillaceae bacterium KN72]|uniref:PA2779 family protein n=1 Tax=Pacificispira spongiicola TaxID=2729598 RepID=A0A7Y0HEN5_9PROT|nr:PA2779 family protein [Pacificispira spongiicola]NMM43763.1 PA2779 family protein [Pacificispira spongiicola]
MKTYRLKAIALTCAVSAAAPAVAPLSAQAAMVGTEKLVTQSRVDENRATIDAFMAREDVREEFRRLGVAPEEADARVAALTDAEAERMASTIRSAPSGQGAVGAIVGAGLIVFLVLLITDILGFTDVFNFTKNQNAS